MHSQAVLKIEGQILSVIEFTMEINRRRYNLALKENSLFLPYPARNLLVKLQETNAGVDQNVKTVAAEFHTSSKEYLEQWCQLNSNKYFFTKFSRRLPLMKKINCHVISTASED